MFNNFYRNKKILITGHTGFKGSWLTLWLNKLGANVLGYSLDCETHPSMFEELNLKEKCTHIIGNILDKNKLEQIMKDFEPEIIFHLAAQPLVRKSYSEPILTYQTNVIGTLNVLECARIVGTVKVFINVTTDKCYENKETTKGYREVEELGGYDMYSSSKACSEILSSSYRRSFLNEKNSFSLATARAGNVIGGGDWAEDRLIPDCIKAINTRKKIEIRNPLSSRPWQFVLEPLSGYLLLAKKMHENRNDYNEPFNFGPKEENITTVEEVVAKVIKLYEKGSYFVNNENSLHEAKNLILNIEKAKDKLNWIPTYSLNESLKETISWYKSFYERNTNMLDFTLKQIENFETKNICYRKLASV